MRRKIWVVALAGIVSAATVQPPALAKDLDARKAPVVWDAADIPWKDNPAMKGARIAVLWGEPRTGGYGALKSVPAGSAIAAHTHSQDQRVILMSGAMVLTVAGGKPVTLGAGSYSFIPAATVHSVACEPGAECVYFEEQQGPADIEFQVKASE